MSTTAGTTRTVTVVRDLDAPPEQVFRAWTEPEQLSWFAGAPVTPERPATVDLRVGGTWQVTLVEGEHRSYRTGGVYLEVDPPRRLAFRWGAVGGWPELDPEHPEATPVMTITLVDTGGSTRMTAEISFPGMAEEQVGSWLGLGVAAGWTETLDRLAPALAAAA